MPDLHILASHTYNATDPAVVPSDMPCFNVALFDGFALSDEDGHGKIPRVQHHVDYGGGQLPVLCRTSRSGTP